MFELTGKFEHSALRCETFFAREVRLETAIGLRRRQSEVAVGGPFQFRKDLPGFGVTLEVHIFGAEPEISDFLFRFFPVQGLQDRCRFVVSFEFREQGPVIKCDARVVGILLEIMFELRGRFRIPLQFIQLIGSGLRSLGGAGFRAASGPVGHQQPRDHHREKSESHSLASPNSKSW